MENLIQGVVQAGSLCYVWQESCRREETRKRVRGRGVVQTTIWSLLDGQTDRRVATSRRTQRRTWLACSTRNRIETDSDFVRLHFTRARTDQIMR